MERNQKENLMLMKKYQFNKKRKICVVTTTRAEYGQLRNLLFLIQKNKNLLLQLVVSGTHLSKSHGHTINEIYNDKIKINYKVNLDLKKFSPDSIALYTAVGLRKFTKCFKKLQPDIVLVLGDRYEIFSAASATLFLGIPLAHIHGGEVTAGVIDESLRHSITKMSDIHFVASKVFQKRVIRMGENKTNVFNFGALTVENIQNIEFLNKKYLERKFRFKFLKNNFMISIHPESSLENTVKIIKHTLISLKKLKDSLLIFTAPNSDAHSNVIVSYIKKFIIKNKNCVYFNNLGYRNFLSCLKICKVLIGNSSSGVLEAPFLKVKSINIGNRQDGRPILPGVICCKINNIEIDRAICNLYSTKNKKSYKLDHLKIQKTKFKILQILKKIKLTNIKYKKFID